MAPRNPGELMAAARDQAVREDPLEAAVAYQVGGQEFRDHLVEARVGALENQGQGQAWDDQVAEDRWW